MKPFTGTGGFNGSDLMFELAKGEDVRFIISMVC